MLKAMLRFEHDFKSVFKGTFTKEEKTVFHSYQAAIEIILRRRGIDVSEFNQNIKKGEY